MAFRLLEINSLVYFFANGLLACRGHFQFTMAIKIEFGLRGKFRRRAKTH